MTEPTRHVAFLRGINVGRAKRIAMADLRDVVTSLGYGDVRTLLNSGNVVFTVSRSARGGAAPRIERAIAARLGVSCRVMAFSAEELAAVVVGNPLLELAVDHSRLLVALLGDKGDRKRLQPLAKSDWAPDALAIGERWAYLWCPAGSLKSPLSVAVGRTLGDATTVRNWATILKVHALAANAG